MSRLADIVVYAKIRWAPLNEQVGSRTIQRETQTEWVTHLDRESEEVSLNSNVRQEE